jgi:peptidoglycan/xylan/chitin deacetylase (PgdA/CDA1 family)
VTRRILETPSREEWLEGIHAHYDSIVLLHSWPDSTAEALPRILDGLAALGAELVDVATLGG